MRGRGRGRGRPLSCLLFILILHLFLTNTHSIQTQVLHIADSLVLFNHKQQVLRTLESSSTTAGTAFPPVAAPPPSSGGDLPSLPSDGWVTTSPTTTNNEPSPSPSSEDGIPFINSNPAVPIPTGETDTTTIRPLPMSGDGTQAVGLGWKDRIQMEVVVGLGVIMCFALSLWW